MIAKLVILPMVAVLALSACATVTNETHGTILVDGETYDLRTLTLDGPQGVYQTTNVRAFGKYLLCLPDSEGDCAAAVRAERTDRRFR